MGSNREKSSIAIALGKDTILIEYQKLLRLLWAPIIFWSTVQCNRKAYYKQRRITWPENTYSRRKYYWYQQNAKYLWCYQIINFSNIAIAILDFSLLLLVKFSLLILFASFWYQFFAFFNCSLSKIIFLSTIAIAIGVALSRS